MLIYYFKGIFSLIVNYFSYSGKITVVSSDFTLNVFQELVQYLYLYLGFY
jgi:hypothetical protein